MGKRLAFVLLVAGLAAACGKWPWESDGQNQTTIVNVNTGNPVGPGGSATATPVAACFVPQVRVGPFGFDCTRMTPPANNAGLLPMDCTGVFTATPKDLNGTDLPAVQHGPDITWKITAGASNVRMGDFSGEPFNKLLIPLAPGPFTVTASVCGTTGSYSGTVVP